MIAEQSVTQLILHWHRRWRRKTRNNYQGIYCEWNIFRRYFIDPDYGLSRNSVVLLLLKNR
jgi:hypothetical protein